MMHVSEASVFMGIYFQIVYSCRFQHDLFMEMYDLFGSVTQIEDLLDVENLYCDLL